MVPTVWTPISPYLVRICLREGPVELVRNGVEVIGEQSGVDVEGHCRGGVPDDPDPAPPEIDPAGGEPPPRPAQARVGRIRMSVL